MKSMFGKIFTLVALLLIAAPSWADPVWIDVRTAEEFAADHIEGDINIPLAEIDTAELAAQFGKDTEIALYCRSGNRAGQAQELLETAGFTKVSNAGGISDVRELRKIATTNSSGAETTAGATER